MNGEAEELINALKVNDRIEVYEGREEAVEPAEAMDKLARMGREVLPALLRELEKYLKEGLARYYAEYIARILGEIRCPESISALVRMLDVDWDDYAVEAAISSLGRFGEDVLDELYRYLDEHGEDELSAITVLDVINEFEGTGDRTVNALIGFLSHKSENVRAYAARSLGRFGDKRCVEYLEDLLDDVEIVVDEAKLSLRFILEDSPYEYRSILLRKGLIGERRAKEVLREVSDRLKSVIDQYSKEFEGDDVYEVNRAFPRYLASKNLAKAFKELAEYAFDEFVLDYEGYKAIVNIADRLDEKEEMIEEEFGDLITILDVDSEFWRQKVCKVEKRDFKSYTVIDVKNEVIKWFRRGKASIAKYRGFIVGKYNSEKIAIVQIFEKKGEVNVELRLHGEDWNEEEIGDYCRDFWEFVEKLSR